MPANIEVTKPNAFTMYHAVKIIVADYYKIIRKYYKSTLTHSNIHIIGDAGNEKELFELLNTVTPDILLLNLNFKRHETSRIFDRIRTKYPFLKIIVLSEFFHGTLMMNYLQRGAMGFIHANCTGNHMEVLYSAIMAVQRGETFRCFHDAKIRDTYPFTDLELTDTEIKISQLIFAGFSVHHMAETLGLSYTEINVHQESIFEKTKSTSIHNFILNYLKLGFDCLAV